MKYNDFQKQQECERQKLIMVDLPILLQKILHLSMIPLPIDREILNLNITEIKKITNAECNNALSYLENLDKT